MHIHDECSGPDLRDGEPGTCPGCLGQGALNYQIIIGYINSFYSLYNEYYCTTDNVIMCLKKLWNTIGELFYWVLLKVHSTFKAYTTHCGIYDQNISMQKNNTLSKNLLAISNFALKCSSSMSPP